MCAGGLATEIHHPQGPAWKWWVEAEASMLPRLPAADSRAPKGADFHITAEQKLQKGHCRSYTAWFSHCAVICSFTDLPGCFNLQIKDSVKVKAWLRPRTKLFVRYCAKVPLHQGMKYNPDYHLTARKYGMLTIPVMRKALKSVLETCSQKGDQSCDLLLRHSH